MRSGNSFSRVVLYEKRGWPPQYWGSQSPGPQSPLIDQHRMEESTARRHHGAQVRIGRRHTAPRLDVTTSGTTFVRRGRVAYRLGAAGTSRAPYSSAQEHHRARGESHLHRSSERQLRTFAGVANYRGSKLVTDEARSYLLAVLREVLDKFRVLDGHLGRHRAGAFSLLRTCSTRSSMEDLSRPAGKRRHPDRLRSFSPPTWARPGE